MQILLLISDSLRYDFYSKHRKNFDWCGIRYSNYWSVYGYTGPSMINILFSLPDTHEFVDYNIHGRDMPDRESPLKKFTDSMFLTQNLCINSLGGWGDIADEYGEMTWEDNELSELLTRGVSFLEDKDDVIVVILGVETHKSVWTHKDWSLDKATEYTLQCFDDILASVDIAILTADHGDCYRNGTYWHPRSSTPATCPEQFQIPLEIIGSDLSSASYEGKFNHYSLMPTIFDLGGKKALPYFQGKSLLREDVSSIQETEEQGKKKVSSFRNI